VDGVRLDLCLDPVHLRVIHERVEERPDRSAGISEVVLDAGLLEPRRNGIDHPHALSSHGSRGK